MMSTDGHLDLAYRVDQTSMVGNKDGMRRKRPAEDALATGDSVVGISSYADRSPAEV